MRTSRRETRRKSARRKGYMGITILITVIILAGAIILSTQWSNVWAALMGGDGLELSADEDVSAPEEQEEAIPADTEPPVITGTKDLEVFIGDPISFKKDVVAIDNSGEEVELVVNSSSVNLKEAGSYGVSYQARDSSGNQATKTITITVKEKPEGYVSEHEVYLLADEILQEIIREDMSQREQAKAIYNWTRGNIGYVNSSEKSDWLKAAYQGFKKRSGDCFVYFSAAQALLNRAGIENQGITKTGGGHYWSLVNVGEEWYHFDTTPRIGDDDDFFMLTDAELEKYSKSHKNSHVWDQSKYPATPKK